MLKDITRKSLILCVIFLSSLCLNGCLSWNTKNNDNSQTQHFIGYTKIIFPKTLNSKAMPFEVKEIKNYGISGGSNGFSLGYTNQKKIILPPENAFYIEVANQEQFDLLQEFINQQKEVNLWVIKRIEN